jgi:ribose transport system ATP-binding protein
VTTARTWADLPPALDAIGLSKDFAGARVLDAVDIVVAAGEVHALVGENGSGKSTFIKILAGYHTPEPGGQVEISGRRLDFGSAASAYRLGCRFVHQDLGLIDTLSVLDNLFLSSGFATTAGTIRTRRAVKVARDALDRIELDVDPRHAVGELSPALRTGVAIARALLPDRRSEARLLVLDEPTASLPSHEVDTLLATVRRIAGQGVGVLYVSHRFAEVFEVTDRVSVLRDGAKIITAETKQLSYKSLVHHLLGFDLEQSPSTKDNVPRDRKAAVAVRVTRLRAPQLHDVSFELTPGQIVGFAGITGSGRESILGAVFGKQNRMGGRVEIGGRELPANRPDIAVRQRMAYVVPDRKSSGGFLELTARENLTLPRLKDCTTASTILRRREQRIASDWMNRLDVRPRDGANRLFGSFSGGNQQKLLFGKWLRTEPLVFLLDEPTQGVDLGAKAELHQLLRDAAAGGMAVAVSSSDLEELEILCHRVLVFRHGRISVEIDARELTPGRLNHECIDTDMNGTIAI